jgi:hypothetical protein
MVMFGGYKYMPAPSQVDPRLPVYKPQMMTLPGAKLSEDDQLAKQKQFAGGVLQGYQYRPLARPDLFGVNPRAAMTGVVPDPVQGGRYQGPTGLMAGMPMQTSLVAPAGVLGGGQITPIQPEGTFVPDDGTGATDAGEEQGKGAYTMRDLMRLERALGQANFGNQTPFSVFELFKDAGGGTYDVDYSQPYSGQLFTVRNDDGEDVPIDQQLGKSRGMSIAINRARSIDESN